MTKVNRIVLNTLATYGRSIYGIALGLFSARWALEALGATDFGLYSVVGSLIVFVGFLNGVSSASIARFYAYSVGKGANLSREEAIRDLSSWFNTAISVHFFVPLLLVVIGYPVAEWVVRHYLIISVDRVVACVWVLRLSMLIMFINMVTLPYTAMYAAYQYLANLSIFGIISSTILFVGTYYLRRLEGDRLIAYSLLMFVVNGLIPIVQSVLARRVFPACRIDMSQLFNHDRLKEMFGFAGWQLFGGVGGVLRAQGSAILINLSFGAKVNAAFSVANQVCAQTSTLSAALLGAITPAVTTEEGSGNRHEATMLAFRACKFGVLLVLLFAIPLMTEIRYVLGLWLKTPPMYADIFCVGMTLVLVIDKLTFGHMVAITATGKIAVYQATLGVLMFCTPFVAWGMIKIGLSVWAVPFSFVLTVTLCSIGRLLFCRKQVGMSIKYWFTNVFTPVSIVFCLTLILGLVLHRVMSASICRLAIVMVADGVLLLALSWIIAIGPEERAFVVNKLRKVVGR